MSYLVCRYSQQCFPNLRHTFEMTEAKEKHCADIQREKCLEDLSVPFHPLHVFQEQFSEEIRSVEIRILHFHRIPTEEMWMCR